jgi:lipoprotein-anchoring transpeptidase ErfK/SrfK
LAVYRGDTPIYVTLTSPGTGRRTPIGSWRIQDKRVWHDMQSRADSDDPYYVEAVPWTMFFKPMYAIHGAYWHWGFGHKASHGCINVAPRDARWLFEHAEPQLPVGWHTINADNEELPGTWIRIR